MQHIFYSLLFSLLCSYSLFGQDTSHIQHFDRDTWEESIKDLRYPIHEDVTEYSLVPDTLTNESPEELHERKSLNIPSFNISTSLSQIIMYSLIAIGVGILLYWLITAQRPTKDKKIDNLDEHNSAQLLEQIEENIHESNIDKFILQAIAQQQYALAIRLYYLNILKELSIRNMIKWKKDKTNQTYIQEIKDLSYQEQLSNITPTYERIWYGNTILDIALFSAVEPAFKSLLLTIQNLPHEAE